MNSLNDMILPEEDDASVTTVRATVAFPRLDKFLKESFPDRSRTELASRIKDGSVRVDGHAARASDEVTIGMVITVPDVLLVSSDVVPEPMDLDIVHEDEDLLVVNKPSGMVVHPGNGNWSGTLLNGLLAHAALAPSQDEPAGSARAGIVHRIDKDTSGLLVVAKSPLAMESLSRQFAAHTITREYTALCEGVILAESGKIEAPLGRDPANRQRFAVVEGGKPATTHFQVRERLHEATLITCRLETGRTHQIRVHLAYIGHPVLNDPLYASKHHPELDPSFGQFLHAGVLGFRHPRTGEELTFSAPLPPYFLKVLEELRVLGQ